MFFVKSNKPLRVLYITSEWPTEEHPHWAPFVVQQIRFIQQAGVDTEVYHFRGRKNPLNYIKFWFELRKCYNLKTFDIIHVHWGQSALLALGSGVPLVITYQGSDLQGYIGEDGKFTLSGRVLQWISANVSRFASALIVVSENLAQYLPDPNRAKVIPSGIDFDLFKPTLKKEARSLLNLPLDKKLVLFAANPRNPIKRHYLAVEAVSSLNQRVGNVELITVSNVPHTQIPLYMSACDVFILTSKHEGSPAVIKEALACNLPVVAVDVGDIRHRLEDIEGCVVCKDDQPETIAEGLEYALKFNESNTFNGRDKVRILDEKQVAAKIIDLYYQILK
ncbi:MAG: glycosyltransferase [Gemmatimonadetes bacterium]|nr:MAG: glycosyltransferase [Gemmatimonadota bacterium]